MIMQLDEDTKDFLAIVALWACIIVMILVILVVVGLMIYAVITEVIGV